MADPFGSIHPKLLPVILEHVKENLFPCRREFKRGFLREFKRGQILEGVFSEDFGPVVAGWAWGLSDCPELSEWVMDEGDG
jgi:hypothetical protein